MWTNFHNHSEYSLPLGRDGAGSPKQRVDRAVELKQDSLVITDHGNLCGVPEHIKYCNDAGIKPIVGMEAYFKPDRHLKNKENKKSWHLILIAKNEDGWKNLLKLATLSNTEGFYNKPCVDYELLQKYGKDIICSSACVSGYLPWLIQSPDHDDRDIDECISKHLDIFGKDYRLEIMPHDLPAQKIVNAKLASINLQYDIPLLATGDSHYPFEDWDHTQDILMMIATNQTLATREKKHLEGDDDVYGLKLPLHMFSEEEMLKMFEGHDYLPITTFQEALRESQNVVDSIEPFELDASPKMPKVKEKEGGWDTLNNWCTEGLVRIGKEADQTYLDRVEHELETIKAVGAIDYFVIVGKMVRWARDAGIRISSGRGSAAGSLVCYLIKITTIDPIAHDLLFERFMNPDRKGLPDIDLDFDAERRDEVKAWLKNEYGEDKVANIVAFGKFGPRAAIKDVGRVLGVSFPELNNVTKFIPEPKDVGGQHNVPSLEVLYDTIEEIEKFAKAYPDVWKHALRIEDRVKQVSQHAGGVVVTGHPIDDYMPLMRKPKSKDESKPEIVTAWSSRADFDVIAMLNMLKIDILSLEGLTRQGKIVDTIEARTGERINLDDLPVTKDPEAVDEDVMKLFSKAQTLNVFQFGGSRGIKSFLKHVKPDRFEDLVAINALYRPGPLQGGDAFKYADLKHGKAEVEYWHESIQPYLQKTYGLMIYQEQLQKIAQVLGNFPPSEADDMRKATSKLYRMGSEEARKFMSQYHDMWMSGCREHGLTEEEADYYWKRMIAFGAYSFNRSHASSYSLFGYQDGWLKVKYPLDFYAASLTIDDNPEEIIREARSRDINILPPDINISDSDFVINEKAILYGLKKIKYVGDTAIEQIMKYRPYHYPEELAEKVEASKCNSRVRNYLLWSGAFDSLGAREDYSIDEKRNQEIEAIGIAISGTGSSTEYDSLLNDRINTDDELELMKEGSKVVIGGEISSFKIHKIKSGMNKGKHMAYATISYRDNSWDCTLFKDIYEKNNRLLKEGNVVMAHGTLGSKGEILVRDMMDIKKFKKAIERV